MNTGTCYNFEKFFLWRKRLVFTRLSFSLRDTKGGRTVSLAGSSFCGCSWGLGWAEPVSPTTPSHL